MKVFFDTNVYIAEALLGKAAEALIQATIDARWRVFCAGHVLEELEIVMVEQLGCSPRFAKLTRGRCQRRAILVPAEESHHTVPNDPADTPVLVGAILAGVDYLVTNDTHLLQLDPYESIRIVSMAEYYKKLQEEGLLPVH